jgi:hypothetical protein
LIPNHGDFSEVALGEEIRARHIRKPYKNKTMKNNSGKN